MKTRLLSRRLWIFATLAAALYSCASIGRIEGGPVDEAPPVFLGATPTQGALNANRSKFSIEFDEYIKLDKPAEKIVISPPQVQQPEVKASGKKVVIELQDTLKANTTYTVDFGDAIQDNNEGNPLENFFYSFSTGAVLDTMSVAGTVLNAANLEPVKGIQVGLHANLADSAFTSLPFDRVGRTDSRGHFSIKGVAPGSYRIYALQDADQNFYYSQPTEIIAFEDSLIIPTMEQRFRQDTTWVDSLTVDTIVQVQYTHYLPDNIMLRCFKEENPNQRFIKSERLTPEKFSLYFSAPADTLPTLRGLNFDERDAFVVENLTGRNDTLLYWVKDTLLHQMDTLRVEMSYLKTDSLNQLVPATDTLNLLAKTTYAKLQKQKQEAEEKAIKEWEKKNKKKSAPRKKREEKEDDAEDKPAEGEQPADETPQQAEEPKYVKPMEFLKADVYAPSSIDIYDYLTLSFQEPLQSVDADAFHLRHKVDTLWVDMPFELEHDTADIKRYNVYADWEFGESYQFEVDSAAITGLYGLHTEAIKKDFKAKKQEEYGQIFFNISGARTPAFVELLDSQDRVVRTVNVADDKADFYFLAPGNYSARLIEDTNGNGKWDTGRYAERRQPEMVYYYPQLLELKANFDLTQEWNVTAKPLNQQKVDDLKKQKPDEKKKKKTGSGNNRSSR